MRFDQIAEREGDAVRVDYVRGAIPVGVGVRSTGEHA